MTFPRRAPRAIALMTGALLVAAACGSSAQNGSSTTLPAAAATTTTGAASSSSSSGAAGASSSSSAATTAAAAGKSGGTAIYTIDAHWFNYRAYAQRLITYPVAPAVPPVPLPLFPEEPVDDGSDEDQAPF